MYLNIYKAQIELRNIKISELEKTLITVVIIIDEKDILEAQSKKLKAEIDNLDKLIKESSNNEKKYMKLSNKWKKLTEADFSTELSWMYIPEDLSHKLKFEKYITNIKKENENIPNEIINVSGLIKKDLTDLLKDVEFKRIDNRKIKSIFYKPGYSKIPNLEKIFTDISKQEKQYNEKKSKYLNKKKTKQNEYKETINKLKSSKTTSKLRKSCSSSKRKIIKEKKTIMKSEDIKRKNVSKKSI